MITGVLFAPGDRALEEDLRADRDAADAEGDVAARAEKLAGAAREVERDRPDRRASVVCEVDDVRPGRGAVDLDDEVRDRQVEAGEPDERDASARVAFSAK